jgi:hypothetical protein
VTRIHGLPIWPAASLPLRQSTDNDLHHDRGTLLKESGTVWLCVTCVLLFYRAEVRACIAGPAGPMRLART